MPDNENPQASPATVERYLGGMDYPASKQDLIEHARQQQAPQDVVSVLERVDDAEYNSPVDLSKAIGKVE